MDNKEAFALIGLVQILLWVNLEDVITHLEPNRLDFVNNRLARLLNVAKSFVSLAIKVW